MGLSGNKLGCNRATTGLNSGVLVLTSGKTGKVRETAANNGRPHPLFLRIGRLLVSTRTLPRSSKSRTFQEASRYCSAEKTGTTKRFKVPVGNSTGRRRT